MAYETLGKKVYNVFYHGFNERAILSTNISQFGHLCKRIFVIICTLIFKPGISDLSKEKNWHCVEKYSHFCSHYCLLNKITYLNWWRFRQDYFYFSKEQIGFNKVTINKLPTQFRKLWQTYRPTNRSTGGHEGSDTSYTNEIDSLNPNKSYLKLYILKPILLLALSLPFLLVLFQVLNL